MYAPQWRPFEADPDVNPFAPGAQLTYNPYWTGSLFGVISFVIRTAFIDPHDELKEAWQSLIAANFPPQATAAFSDMGAVDYSKSSWHIRDVLRSPNKLEQVALARALNEHFRQQYRRAADLARRGM